MKRPLVFAQLRDVLTAENSAIVTQKHYDCQPILPQRTKLDFLPVDIGQHNIGKPRAIRLLHRVFSRGGLTHLVPL